MEAQTNHNSTPDAWDENDEMVVGDGDQVGEIDKGLRKLNVDATPFIPGQNVFAKEFKPSFGSSASEPGKFLS